MRKKHTFEFTVDCKCPAYKCNEKFRKRVTLTYWTDQNGNVIDHLVR